MSLQSEKLTQPDLLPNVTPQDVERLRAHLHLMGWRTRRQLVEMLQWSERKIRDVAESMGADVVRGQKGFKLTADLKREDLSAAIQARDAALSQGRRMIRYGLALGAKLHGRIS